MTRRLDLLAIGVAVVGVVALVAGIAGALREDEAAFALPFVASGVIGGLAMVVFGLGLLRLQASRRRSLVAHHEHVARLASEGAS